MYRLLGVGIERCVFHVATGVKKSGLTLEALPLEWECD